MTVFYDSMEHMHMMTTHPHSQADALEEQSETASKHSSPPEMLVVSPIVKALEKYMTENGLSMKELSDERYLGMPYSTLSSAMRGARPFPSDRDTRSRIAQMMGVPGLQVAIWCELLNIEDFIVKESFEQDAEKALQAMREDPTVAHFIPPDSEWKKIPESGKVALVLMYQTLVGRRFLQAAHVADRHTQTA
jgi:uncharacterized protein (DUF2384 family)